jgi:lysophospholipase L1-like esterase
MGKKSLITLIAGTAVLLTAAASIFLLESLLHVYFFATNGYWLFLGRDNFKASYVKLVADRRQYSLRENARDGTVSVNSEGFRGRPFHPDDRRPVLCVIGDSVPFGAGVNDDETFPVHLQRALNERGFAYRVLNAGVPSYNLRQSLDRWRIDVRPRYDCKVIILNAANDVSLIAYYKNAWTPDLTWADIRFGIRGVYLSSIVYFAKSLATSRAGDINADQLNNIIDTLRHDFLAQLAQIQIPITLLPINVCIYTNLPIEDSRNAVSCRAAKTYYIEYGRAWGSIIKSVNSMLRGVREEGVYFFDTNTLLDEATGREEKFVDFVHLSDQGARVIAEYLANELIERSLVKR